VLVYGDHSESASPRERLDAVGETLAAVAAMPAGLERHSRLVGALVEAGQLLQGVADLGAASDELNAFLYDLAKSAIRSWDTGFAEIGNLPALPGGDLPPCVELRLPEGFAFYAVYPEAYADAARKLRLSGLPRVIGIRSIGTTLGAVVAAAIGAPPPITVRPFGDPFAREVEVPAGLIGRDYHYVIVDEGPGLSGSSFGAVADWLEARGVPPERIAFLPSHDGDPGPHASERHRTRWSNAQRIAAELEPRFLAKRFGPLQPCSTGHPGERLKYLGTHEGRPVLLKFAGLGGIGERKLQMARALHAAGLVPEPAGFAHGFIVERWCEGAETPRGKPLEQIAGYIGARARLFPATREDGASVHRLFEMSRRNASLALGENAGETLERWTPMLDALSRRVVPVRTDNKLHREEWLRTSGGHLLKCDALDHHCAHDLIGCQDMAWDVAGAVVEFELDDAEAAVLVDATMRAAGRYVDPELLEFCRIAYCCFRAGQASISGDQAAAHRYGSVLNDLLHQHDCRGTRQESSVG